MAVSNGSQLNSLLYERICNCGLYACLIGSGNLSLSVILIQVDVSDANYKEAQGVLVVRNRKYKDSLCKVPCQPSPIIRMRVTLRSRPTLQSRIVLNPQSSTSPSIECADSFESR